MKNPRKSGKGAKPKTYAEAVEALGLTLDQALKINQKKYKKERDLMRDSGLAVWKAAPRSKKNRALRAKKHVVQREKQNRARPGQHQGELARCKAAASVAAITQLQE